MPDSPVTLTADSPAAVPVLAIGSGLPTAIEGRPVYYRRRKAAYARDYRSFTHPGSKETFDLTTSILGKVQDSVRRRAKKGIRPFITPYHVDPRRDPDARDTLGYVLDVERAGDDLPVDMQLIGDDALHASAGNSVSVCLIPDQVDADGEHYEWVFHHLALTPNPALHGLGGHIAASGAAGLPPLEVRAYSLCATTNDKHSPGDPGHRSTLMKPETLTKLRAKLKLGADVKDDDVAERAAELALIDPPPDKTAEVTALSARVTALESERDTAKADVLRLSANRPADTDPFIIRDRAASSSSLIDAMVAGGDMPQCIAEKIKPVILADKDGKGGTGAALMLSASPALGGERPIDFTLGLFKGSGLGIKLNNGVARGEPATMPPLSASITNSGAELTKEQQAEVDRSLKATETGRRAIAARKSA